MFKRALAISGLILLSSFSPSMAAISDVAATCGASCDTAIATEVNAEISAIQNNPSLTPAQKDAALIVLIDQIAAVQTPNPTVRAALAEAVRTVGGSLSNAGSDQVQASISSIAGAVSAGTQQTDTAAAFGGAGPGPGAGAAGGATGGGDAGNGGDSRGGGGGLIGTPREISPA